VTMARTIGSQRLLEEIIYHEIHRRCDPTAPRRHPGNESAHRLSRSPELRYSEDVLDRGDAVLEVVEQGTVARAQVVVRNSFTALYGGRPVDVPGVMWFTVEDGLIIRRTDVWDSAIFVA
jgi:hypothetical protein